MKILFTRELNGQDYLCDLSFYGLSKLPGIEITDAPRMWYMYKNEFEPIGSNKLGNLYGRGFTVWGLMDEPQLDRSNIEQCIRDHYYDIVILSRVDFKSPYLDLILQYYKPHEIISLDGKDATGIDMSLVNRSVYFKRELINPVDGVLPISFSIPDERCRLYPQVKTQVWARSKPKKHNQPTDYLFTNQDDYHNDYATSLFGLTFRKNGWDCMRHYEILANRCIPYFEDISALPVNISMTLPKELLIHSKQRVDKEGAEYFLPNNPGWEEYQEMEQAMHEHFIKHATATKVAEYILQNIKRK